jgi:hypothetical protein
VVAVVMVALAALAGCGGGGSTPAATPTTTTPVTGRDPAGSRLTLAQSLQLSQILYRNYTEGGADVVVHVPFATQESATITGAVDFVHHEGHLLVRTVFEGQRSTEHVDYTVDRVYERGGPVVAKEIAASGRHGVEWVSRAPDEQTRPVDKIIAIIVALASPERDNPLLIQQGDARWEGAATVDGTVVDRYRYSASISYVVGAHDGLLREFLGTIQEFAGTVTVDLSSWGPKHEPPPPTATVLATTGSAGD